jgi:hypothetical protein
LLEKLEKALLRLQSLLASLLEMSNKALYQFDPAPEPVIHGNYVLSIIKVQGTLPAFHSPTLSTFIHADHFYQM